MRLLDDHFFQHLPDPVQTLAPLLPAKEQLIWANYQRPTARLRSHLIIHGLFWLLRIGLFVTALWGAITYNITGLQTFLFVFFLLIGIQLPPYFVHYCRLLFYPKHALYGATKDHLLVLSPWQDQPIRYKLTNIPGMKVFGRTDGTITVSYLVQGFIRNSNEPTREDVLFRDAIGDQQTVALIKNLYKVARTIN